MDHIVVGGRDKDRTWREVSKFLYVQVSVEIDPRALVIACVPKKFSRSHGQRSGSGVWKRVAYLSGVSCTVEPV